MSTNIADQLLHGSENTDIMKSKIEKLVKMILGFARKTAKFQINLDNWLRKDSIPFRQDIAEFKGDSCVWRVSLSGDSDGKISYSVNCQVRDDGVWMPAYDSETGSIWNTDVKVVYENLNVFVTGMTTVFPELPEAWAFLLKNAKMEL